LYIEIVKSNKNEYNDGDTDDIKKENFLNRALQNIVVFLEDSSIIWNPYKENGNG